MRDSKENNYGNFSRRYRQENPQSQQSGWASRNRSQEEGQGYRLQHSEEYGRRGGERGMREDRYYEMYDTTNYTATPRSENYGLPYGSENDLDKVRHFPLSGDPYGSERSSYRYSQGYNPNYDNPEEGDRYRDFDSRGNHGFRHDAAYGSTNEFRDFGDDRYGQSDRTSNRYYGYFGGYNR